MRPAFGSQRGRAENRAVEHDGRDLRTGLEKLRQWFPGLGSLAPVFRTEIDFGDHQRAWDTLA